MTNSTGTVESQYAYDPFGRATLLQGSIAAEFQFAGYYMHSSSGLNLTRTRAYNANLGRFINRDKIGESGGVNLFAHVLNVPSMLRDTQGLWVTTLSTTLRAQALNGQVELRSLRDMKPVTSYILTRQGVMPTLPGKAQRASTRTPPFHSFLCRGFQVALCPTHHQDHRHRRHHRVLPTITVIQIHSAVLHHPFWT